jgi:hypothetical protein
VLVCNQRDTVLPIVGDTGQRATSVANSASPKHEDAGNESGSATMSIPLRAVVNLEERKRARSAAAGKGSWAFAIGRIRTGAEHPRGRLDRGLLPRNDLGLPGSTTKRWRYRVSAYLPGAAWSFRVLWGCRAGSGSRRAAPG